MEDRAVPAANIWVSTESSSTLSQHLREYTPTGTLVSSRFIPKGSSDGNARDLAVDASGNVHVYNGTFTAYVASLNPTANTWQEHTASGLSQANVTFFGGIATFGNYVFAPDYATGDANGNNPNSGSRGLVRFNRADWSFTRFAEGFDLHDVTVGQDGKVYALDYYRTIYVYDPDTLAAVRSFQVPNTIDSEWAEPRGIAVNAAGEVYVVHSSDHVARYTPAGVLIDKVRVNGTGSGAPSGFYSARDVDISPDGTQLAVGSASGHVVLLNSLLGDVRYFTAGTSGDTFVSFGLENGPVLPGVAVMDTTLTEGDDGTKTASFTVRLTIPSSTTVTVDWATSDGTAIAGTDYQSSGGIVTFAPGELSKTVTVNVIGDRLRESNENFKVILSNVSTNAQLFRAQATATITDDDPPFVQRLLNSYGYARDYQGDGTFEYFVHGMDPTAVFSNPNSSSYKAERTLFEFDVSGISGDSVGTVSLELNLQSVVPGSQPIEVWGYPGNGAVEQADAGVAAVLLGTFAPPAYGHVSVGLDRDAVMALVGQSNFLGLRLVASAPTTNVAIRSGIYNYDPTKLVFFNSAVPVPTASITDVSVTEGNSLTTVTYRDMNFTITLSQASTEPVSVGVGTQFLTASYNTDYEWAAGVTPVTFNPGETSKTVTARARGDSLDEFDETFYMQLLTPNGVVVSDGLGLGTIVDDDAAPTLTVANASLSEGSSGQQYMQFQLRLSQASGKPASVDFYTSNITATAGSDYGSISGTASFSPGSTTTTLYVPVYGDTIFEGSSETFYLNFMTPVNLTLGTTRATGTITEDDSYPTFSASSPTVTEAAAGTVTASFTVMISPASFQTVSVNYATENETAIAGTDYVATSGTLTFSPGQTSKTVSVTVNPDFAQEGRETFRLRFTSPSGATLWYPTTFATILDEDTSELLNGPVAHGHVQDVGGDGFETVVNAPYSVDVRNLTYIPSGTYAKESRGLFEFNLAEVQASPNAMIQSRFEFYVNGLSGQTGVPQMISVYGYGANGTIEMGDLTAAGVLLGTFDANLNGGTGRRYVNLDATAVSNLLDTTALIGLRLEGAAGSNFSIAGPAASGLAPPTLIFAMGDPPVVPSVSVDDTTGLEATVGSGPFGFANRVFAVQLSESTTVPVTVQYATADGTAISGATSKDFESTSGSVIFQPGEVTKSITVRVRGENTHELDESFFFRLTGATNGTIADGEAVGTLVNDDDIPRLVLGGYGYIEGDEGTTQFAYSVSLSNPTYQEVRVNWTTADGTATAGADYQAASGTSIVAPETNGTHFLGTFLNDTLKEDYEEQFYLEFSDPVNAIIIPENPRGIITIYDNESLPGISVSDVTIVEGDSGTRNAVFTLTLDSVSPLGANYPPSVVVETVDGTATAGSDYTALAPRTISFPYGTTSATVSVSILGDLMFEADETFTLKLSSPRYGHIAEADRAGLATITNDDTAPAVRVDDVTLVERTGTSSTAVFAVYLSNPVGSPVTVDFTTADGTASEGSDYTLRSGTITFEPGETVIEVSVPVGADSLHELDETFELRLSNAVNASIADVAAQAIILNDDAVPALSVGDVSVTEGDPVAGGSDFTNLVFTVTLSAASGLPVTIDYATVNGIAMAADYEATNGSLTFAAGEISKNVIVNVRRDTIHEADDTLYLRLSNAGGASVADGEGVGTILNDDQTPQITIADHAVSEGFSGSENVSFTATLSNLSDFAVTFDYATANGTASAGSDYTAVSGSATINAGSQSYIVSVPVIGDTLYEANESYEVLLSKVQGATVSDGTAIGTINNDDEAPSLSITDVTLVEGNAGSTDAKFTVTLPAVSGVPVTGSFATADGTALAGSDYIVATGTFTIPAGEQTTTVLVGVSGDSMHEIDETFQLNLSGVSGATVADGQAIATVQNDDSVPAISIADVTLLEGNTGVNNAVFTIELSNPTYRTVTVAYATANGTATAGSDYQATANTLTFAPGETNKTITVLVSGDRLPELNETFFVNLSNPTNASTANSQGLGTITDNEPRVSVNDVTRSEGKNRDTTLFTFTITLSVAYDQPVTMSYKTTDGTAKAGDDYTARTGTLTFAPGETSKTITIEVKGDNKREANETFYLDLYGLSTFGTFTKNRGLGTILNDD